MAFSPEGKRLAIGSREKYVKLWNVVSGREICTLEGHTWPVVKVEFSPDGARVVSCSSNSSGWGNDQGKPCEVKVWDAHSGAQMLSLKGHTSFVNCVTFSADGKRLATLSRDNTVKVWDALTGHEQRSLDVVASIAGGLAFSPDGKRLAGTHQRSHESGQVNVWEIESGEVLLTLKGHSAWVTSVTFSPDGSRLVTGAGGHTPNSLGEVKVWDAMTGHEVLTLNGRSGLSNDVMFSADGYRLTGIGRDDTVKIWDATPVSTKH